MLFIGEKVASGEVIGAVVTKVGDILVLKGKPCAGKSTAAEVLTTEAAFHHHICSEVIIARSLENPELAAELQELRDKGKLWGDSLVNSNMLATFGSRLKHGQVSDGYPRTLNQAQRLMQFARCVRAKVRVTEIRVSDELSEERRRLRALERKQKKLPLRKDDKKRVHTRRVRDYNRYSPAVLAYFRAQPDVEVLEIDGRQSKEAIKEAIRAFVLTPEAVAV